MYYMNPNTYLIHELLLSFYNRSKRARVPLFLWGVVVVSAVSLALLHTYVQPSSRRLGNAAFVAFSVSTIDAWNNFDKVVVEAKTNYDFKSKITH